jgi:hypothetical protein
MVADLLRSANDVKKFIAAIFTFEKQTTPVWLAVRDGVCQR